MERRDQVSRLQAELAAKKLELAQLQQRVHRAEVSRRSQQSGRCSITHTQQEDNGKSASHSAASNYQASQGLVRRLDDPHSPVWLSGQLYPAQYLIRQTRSMSKAQAQPAGTVVKLHPPPPDIMLEEREFELPDDVFLSLKEEKLKRSRRSLSQEEKLKRSRPSLSQGIHCELAQDSGTLLQLQCTGLITCLEGKVSGSQGKLVVGRNETFLVSFNSHFFVCQRELGARCNSYPLSKAVDCFDFICTRNGVCVVAVAHSSELLVLMLTGNDWETLSLPTDHLGWPSDYHCQLLCLSECCDSIQVAACCSELVGVWKIVPDNKYTSEVICCVSIPLICSLLVVEDLLVALTSQHECIICCTSGGSSVNQRKVSLTCCTKEDIASQTNVNLELLAAKKTSEVLLLTLTTGKERVACSKRGHDIAAWIIAVKVSDNIPYLLHTYRLPNSTSNQRLALRVQTHRERGWDLIGVTEKAQIFVWKARQEFPIATITVRATEGACVRGVDWDTTSDTCLVLDKFKQVHYFQNTHIL